MPGRKTIENCDFQLIFHHDVNKFTRGQVLLKMKCLESILHNCSDIMFRDFPPNMDWDLNTSAPKGVGQDKAKKHQYLIVTVKGSNILMALISNRDAAKLKP